MKKSEQSQIKNYQAYQAISSQGLITYTYSNSIRI